MSLDGSGPDLELLLRRIIREEAGLTPVVPADKWRDGEVVPLSQEELREDPLIASSLEDAFLALSVEEQEPTTRVIEGRELLCRQLVMATADTSVADLPAGRMIQETVREISVAVHDEVPFLGLAYVAERVRAESRLDPPSRRFRPPVPQVRVEIMELVAFGRNASSAFPASN